MINFISRSIILVPDVIPLLGSGFYKTYDYFLDTVERLIRSVYNGNMGGDFVDVMGSLLTGQITQAYQQAWENAGETSYALPDFLQSAMNDMITQQTNFDFIYQFYTDIVDARVDGTSIDPLLSRADLWANRYDDAYNAAVAKIESETGGKLIWKLGATEKHCLTCAALDGVVAFASDWDATGLHPGGGPNDKLECGGWRCDCSLEPTDQRRSPDSLDQLYNAGMLAGM